MGRRSAGVLEFDGKLPWPPRPWENQSITYRHSCADPCTLVYMQSLLKDSHVSVGLAYARFGRVGHILSSVGEYLRLCRLSLGDRQLPVGIFRSACAGLAGVSQLIPHETDLLCHVTPLFFSGVGGGLCGIRYDLVRVGEIVQRVSLIRKVVERFSGVVLGGLRSGSRISKLFLHESKLVLHNNPLASGYYHGGESDKDSKSSNPKKAAFTPSKVLYLGVLIVIAVLLCGVIVRLLVWHGNVYTFVVAVVVAGIICGIIWHGLTLLAGLT